MSQTIELSTFGIILGSVLGSVVVVSVCVALCHDHAWGLRHCYCVKQRRSKSQKTGTSHGTASHLPLYSASRSDQARVRSFKHERTLRGHRDNQPPIPIAKTPSIPDIENQVSLPPSAHLSGGTNDFRVKENPNPHPRSREDPTRAKKQRRRNEHREGQKTEQG
ncbi:hypothetical protein B0T21DRAFT_351174 [Apiosordaria backusii]|uniref:Uncharacterized protein n=1 Tax=Apiosordaria backusii TaxID=314023 RepID=A0AA40DZA9_9PEZI|nr:hypothetical protein B0T21DRAFT_351174 [Apiosordaria backusii]